MNANRTTSSMLAIAVAIGLSTAAPAIAQIAPGQTAANSNPAAREHFDRGVAAFEQRRFAEAAKEFRTAYELSPTYVVLYNIGQVSAALGQAVESVDAFQAYLDQGGSTIPEERRAAVMLELEKQRALIGTIVVHAKPDGAQVHIDGKFTSKAPIAKPIRLTAGKHSVVVMLEGYEAQARELSVTAGSESELELTLQSTKSTAPAGATPNPVVVVSGPGTQTSTPSSTIVNVQVPQQKSEPLSTHQRTAGYVLGGLGLVVVGVGAYINVTAVADARDAKANYDSEAYSAAKTRTYWGWGAVGAGAVVATTGMVLLFTAPSSSDSSAIRVSPFSDGIAHGIAASTNW